ncbi:MAG: NAD(P)-binding protein [Cyanobacteria bacterium SZAS TMP-1]|nr:NAD(P)-binding protein [Cyanobacteria bacterium SZAS TMP-1]
MTITNVAIVGAGLAGLVCGSLLSENGMAVTVFDKGRFPGGRLASRDRDLNTFDYGAQYFTSKDERFIEYLRPLLATGIVAQWNGKFGKMLNGTLSEETLSRPRYVGVPLMRSLIDRSADALDCKLSHRVTAATREAGKWALSGTVEASSQFQSFQKGDYDFLILNMPPAQAAALCPHPALEQVTFRPCIALMQTFEERLPMNFDGVILETGSISWVARDSSKPGRPAGERWVIHGSPDWSQDNFQEDQAQLEENLAQQFATIFDISREKAQFSKLHKWRYALPIVPSAQNCIVERETALAYCGDWCAGPRVEGAFLSGLATANEILGAQTV